nr:EAL domain-containing protein [Acetobacter orientalis]
MDIENTGEVIMCSELPKNEFLYKLLVQNVFDYAIYFLSPDGVVTSWNAGAEKAKGYTEKEIIGKNFSIFYSEKDQKRGLPQKALETAHTKGKFEGDGWRFRKDGSKLRAYVVIDPIYNDKKEIIGYAKITKDITREYKAKIIADEQSRNFRLMAEGIKDYIMYMIDRNGKILNWNSGAQRAKGYTTEEVLGKHFSIFFTEDDCQSGLPYRALATALAKGKFEHEGFRIRRNGTSFWSQTTIDPVYDEKSQHIGFATITKNLTEQKKNQDATNIIYRNLNLALEHMSQGLCLFDKNECMVICNDRFTQLLGINQEKFEMGSTFTDFLWLLHTTSNDSISEIAKSVDIQRQKHFENAEPGKINHEEYVFNGLIINFSNRFLADGGWVSTIEDITEKRKIENEVKILAHHDFLTGLKNRTSYQKKIDEIFGADNNSLLFVDVDLFKEINDQFGHPAGDNILREVGKKIQKNLSKKETVYRIGGDEFAIICRNSNFEEDVLSLCGRILREFNTPIQTEWGDISLSVSIGVASSSDCKNIDTWVQHTDLALYAAKEAGRNQFLRYEKGMREAIQKKRKLEFDLKKSLEHEDFFLVYQPVVNAQTHKVSSFEALLRWKHPVDGIIPPINFIPFAEEIGLMPSIDMWVVKAACKEALSWPHHVSVSINISAKTFELNNISESILKIIEDVNIDPGRVEIEITETSMLLNAEETINKIKKLTENDIKIALDDFGTGYSSLSFLRDIPFNRIKIDRSFIKDIESNIHSIAIIKAIAGIGDALGVSITAEGVETASQISLLMRDKCYEHQGYYISKPFEQTHILPWILSYESEIVSGTLTEKEQICLV